MEIGGPFLDRLKARRRQPRCWFLRYAAPKLNADGTTVLDAGGRPVMQRFRPFYESKAQAVGDKPRILAQYDATGAGNFLFNRESAADYDAAKKIVGDMPLVDVAKFWRLHHPEKAKPKLGELFEQFLADVKIRLGLERHYADLKSRGGAFVASGFGNRYPDTITRQEIMTYLMGLPDAGPRTRRNHKTTICALFNWLLDRQHITANPAAGIKKRMLPRESKKEIEFLSLEQVDRYLRAAERYDPGIVAHEVVQLIAGVRADDEMADFCAEFVYPQTKEVVIPAAIAKTKTREVIDGLEDSFWAWWDAYAPKKGLLRPANYLRRWRRVRVLASIADQDEADRLAKIPIKRFLRSPEAYEALLHWPWNARRRTFCTFHIAKHQSAAKTALILRHRGSSYTLHNSYRGLGVTREQGVAYFQILPAPFAKPIQPIVELRGAAFQSSQLAQSAIASA